MRIMRERATKSENWNIDARVRAHNSLSHKEKTTRANLMGSASLFWVRASNHQRRVEIHSPENAMLRQHVVRTQPEIGHDLSALRRESIRLALHRANEDTGLAEAAFEVFFTERMQVDLFDDARPALAFLAARFPLVALSNGNADVGRVGVGEFFMASLSAQEFGVGKPDPRIFHAAASSAGVASDDVLHVGDDAALDVLGGLGAGMQTVWVNRHEHLWSHEAQPHVTVATLSELCDLLQAAPVRP